ncbi:MAG TPA: N-acetylmuramoyl-L-alanine amidase [Gammaproteobacteria bacterium]
MRMRNLLILLGLLSFPTGAIAAPVTVEGVRIWEGPEETRVVFDLSAPVDHAVFSLEDPERVVVDLGNARMDASVDAVTGEGRIARIRHAPRNGTDLRVVFDLSERLKPKSFLVKPNGEYGNRLVLDLEVAAPDNTPAPVKRLEQEGRELLIAIDAGHGGEDPGAMGHQGTREKDVALQIARELAKKIDAEPGMRALLIRDGDYFLELAERREKARQHRADMFVSIHADAFPDKRANGASIYVVSERGASSEAARILAERENAADLVGGISLSDKDDLLASVLMDLSSTATLSASLNAGARVLNAIDRVADVHKSTVQQAGFVVLKSPDVPSILVETAFISNPAEERKLKDRGYQRKLAESIARGIHDYFYDNPPLGTLIAAWQGRGDTDARRHAVRSGETLSGIARQYKVSLQTLRTVNGKSDDTLLVGEKLVIPLGS